MKTDLNDIPSIKSLLMLYFTGSFQTHKKLIFPEIIVSICSRAATMFFCYFFVIAVSFFELCIIKYLPSQSW